MGKRGVAAIAGETHPVVGQKVTFRVVEWHPGTPAALRDEAAVTWELFKKRANGQYTRTGIKKKGVGEFTFGQRAAGQQYAVEGYVYGPDWRPPTMLYLSPKASGPRIIALDLLDAEGEPLPQPMKYGQSFVARAKCVGMEGLPITMRLWEDDDNNAGHTASNARNEGDAQRVVVKRGIAECRFVLKPDLVRLANAQRDGAGDKLHEYYVTAEFRHGNHTHRRASGNAEAQNPAYEQPRPPSPAPAQQAPAAPRPAQPAVQQPSGRQQPTLPPPPPSRSPRQSSPSTPQPAQRHAPNPGPQTPTTPTTPAPAEPTVVKKPVRVAPAVGRDPAPKPQGNRPVVVASGNGEDATCFCKQNAFAWSALLKTCADRKKVLEVAAALWGEATKKEKASELMAIMHLETGGTFDPAKDNGKGYVGLIQFSSAAAKSVGTTKAALVKMTFVEQMDYVQKYLAGKRDKLKTITDFYLQVLKPGDVGKGSDRAHKVFDESIAVPDNGKADPETAKRNIQREPWVTKYGYASNPTFMTEKDEHTKRLKWVYTKQRKEMRWGFEGGATTVGEIEDVLKKEHYTPGVGKVYDGPCKDGPSKPGKPVEGKRAPWMAVAMQEAKTYGGKKEGTIDGRIREYHKAGGASGSGSKTAWCASFACWCLKQVGQPHPGSAASRAFISSANTEKCEVFWGAAAVFRDCSADGKKVLTTGHVAFVYGTLPGTNRYALLGGNQGQMLKVSGYDCSGNVFLSYTERKRVGKGKKRKTVLVKHYKKFVGFYKPKDYELTDADKFLPEEAYASTDAANETLGIGVKSTKGGESSR